jgi:AbrB family looped-hinge helix DNA binding protein
METSMGATKTSTGKVNRSFQITIPKKYREAFNLGIGDIIGFDIQEDGILVRPLDLSRRQALKRIEELIKKPVNDDLSALPEDKLMEVINEQIREMRTGKPAKKAHRR